MGLLCSLSDIVPSIQHSTALAIDWLSNFSKELANNVVQNDIITHLKNSLSNQNRFFKKVTCFVLKSVVKCSPNLPMM